VFRRQILILQEQFLIHRAGHIRQQSHPFAVPHRRLSYSVAVSSGFLTIRASEPVELDEAMNAVGEFAWELADIIHHAGEKEDSYYTAVFKRPKQT